MIGSTMKKITVSFQSYCSKKYVAICSTSIQLVVICVHVQGPKTNYTDSTDTQNAIHKADQHTKIYIKQNKNKSHYITNSAIDFFVFLTVHLDKSIYVIKPTQCTFYRLFIPPITSTRFGHVIAHHQEVSLYEYIHNNLYVLFVLVGCMPASRQSTKTYNTYQFLYRVIKKVSVPLTIRVQKTRNNILNRFSHLPW
jgi:hypothetical protein